MTERERIITDDHQWDSAPQHRTTGGRVYHTEVWPTTQPAQETLVYDAKPMPTNDQRRLAQLERARQIIYFVANFIAALILFRVGLLALGANPENAFANFIYTITLPFVAPFLTLFGDLALDGGLIELSSLFAIAVYYLVAWTIVRLMYLLLAPQRESARSGIAR